MLSDSDNFLQVKNLTDFRLIWIWVQLSFWKAQVHHSLQSVVSHTTVNKYTLDSYLLMSAQTKHQMRPEFLVGFSIYCIWTK